MDIQMINQLMQLMNNPMQAVSKAFNIPQGMSQPQDILQHLLNTNQITQQQVNNAMGMRNNPMLKQFFK